MSSRWNMRIDRQPESCLGSFSRMVRFGYNLPYNRSIMGNLVRKLLQCTGVKPMH